MKIEFSDLPYAKNALEPIISEKTVDFHYNKHHRGYFNKLVKAIKDTELEDKRLDEIIDLSEGTPDIYNLAAQVWNHDFYWHSMSPNGGGEPPERVKNALLANFGSMEKFMEQIKSAAKSHFGSGWVWLVAGENEKLSVLATDNAINPSVVNHIPLMTIDVWEHAFYLDYQNDKAAYVDQFFDKLINWEFVEYSLDQLEKLNAA